MSILEKFELYREIIQRIVERHEVDGAMVSADNIGINIFVDINDRTTINDLAEIRSAVSEIVDVNVNHVTPCIKDYKADFALDH